MTKEDASFLLLKNKIPIYLEKCEDRKGYIRWDIAIQFNTTKAAFLYCAFEYNFFSLPFFLSFSPLWFFFFFRGWWKICILWCVILVYSFKIKSIGRLMNRITQSHFDNQFDIFSLGGVAVYYIWILYNFSFFLFLPFPKFSLTSMYLLRIIRWIISSRYFFLANIQCCQHRSPRRYFKQISELCSFLARVRSI